MQSVPTQKDLPFVVPKLLSAVFLFLTLCNSSYAQSCPAHLSFRVEVAPGLASEPLSGRLIVMMSTQSKPTDKITPSFGPDAHSVWVAAKEIHNLTADAPVELDPDELAYPQKFCTAPEGSYKIQAVLDVNHDFAYHDDASGDFVSRVIEQNLHPATAEVISLTLTDRKTDAPLQLPPRTELFDFVSPKLSEYWGRPIHMRGAVLVPPSYSSGKRRYPTVYMTHGFGADMRYLAQRSAGNVNKLMEEKKIPEMIWVFMLEACPGGTHEFADSVNNGPWGTALTTELIPDLEKKYRMDAKPSGRFLTGHSSGGWAALWIQVSHPEFFGGTWPTAPDTTDFRTFAAQTDLTKQPPPNFYRTEDGSPRMFIRMDGKDTQSMEDLARQEQALGDYGGQLASFEWVFSPRGKDGRPMPLFDRDTGNIDPEVAAYWEKHYDIANLLRTNWKKVGPLLNGKIHMTVGTADTFHLDESARLLEQTIKELGGKASFTYLEGRNHFDLYQGGLAERIAKEMYAIARPASSRNVAAHQKPQ
jgi:hypothetical protein